MSDPSKYSIGWICAISTEYVAARAFLDATHDPPECVAPNDGNEYTLGQIGKHNVVVAVLPDAEYGLSTASAVAKGMLCSFPNIRAGLMVGIAGGAPILSLGRDIRLGDIVVSSPCDGHGGVFQYDFGKLVQTVDGQTFQPTRFLNQPPDVLRAAVTGLKVEIEEQGHTIDQEIEAVFAKKPRLRSKYSRPPPEADKLYLSHVVSDSSKPEPGPEMLVHRPRRTEEKDNPAIFYGLIASANQLIKDATQRDKLAKSNQVLCFEMEAAGLMNHFPCLVIRGICDYSDSHKNKQWQGYAAMAAAAYGRAIIRRIQRNRLELEKKLTSVLSNDVENVRQDVSQVKVMIDYGNLDKLSVAEEAEYNSSHNQHEPKCHPKTRIDLLEEIQVWAEDENDHRIYWLSGSAGTGKSTISRTIAQRFYNEKLLAATFFFKRGIAACNTASMLFSTIARQLARHRPALQSFLIDAIKETDNIASKGIEDQYRKLIFNPMENAFINIYEKVFEQVYRKVYKTTFKQVYLDLIKTSKSSDHSIDVEKYADREIVNDLQYILKPAIEEALRLAHGTKVAETQINVDAMNTDVEYSYEQKFGGLLRGEALAMSRRLASIAAGEDEASQRMAKKAARAKAYEKAFEASQEEVKLQTSFLVLDALDECSSAEDIAAFVPLLSELSKSRVFSIKVFLTSRPEHAVRCPFTPITGLYEKVLHKVMPEIVSRDIRIFLRDELAAMKDKWNARKRNNKRQQLQLGWPGESRLEILVEQASGIFIFAATICRFLDDPFQNPEDQLSLVIDATKAGGINHRLSPTYLPVLWQLKINRTKQETDFMLNMFRRIVGTVILIEQPLPVDSISGLLGIDVTQVERILDPLISLIDIPEDRNAPVKPFHLSFRDFLLSPEAGNFQILYQQTHQQIALSCMDLLTNTRRHQLHYNMCNLDFASPSTVDSDSVSRYLQPHVQYACLYWVYHLSEGGMRIQTGDEAYKLLRTHLLHWLEVLSILGPVENAISMLNRLIGLVDVSPPSPRFCRLTLLSRSC
ncbi:putative pfs domain-containing protein [Colletotrichum karsti]|uniref:Pfs domain-containing protein n=1 Tax=Colletotrichum karsti TaxID=1095194 RepID=A0A9P6LN80_9PEZI|nr:putative pfs domain-containing protein [Colletotrichum karsti]KAF9878267.1 putative pfs domain-containing protein [Colletotrichum karsti]